jgi:hypothetical protein
MRVYVTFVICSICILAGACGNSLPLASSLSVAITPPTATVTAGTRVNLTGSGSGFTETPTPEWQMVEGGQFCGFLAGFTQNANFANCPAGYVVYPINKFPSPGTYYAPPTGGVYHAQFTAMQFSGGSHFVSKSATANVTVTP